MRTLAFLAVASLIAVFLPGGASAQGSRSVGAAQVTITVPERRSAAASSSTLAGWGGAQGGGTTGLRALQGAPGSALECLATLELPGIGSLSVSCLETADTSGRSTGVALELRPNPGMTRSPEGRGPIELHLADGAVIRLNPRAFADGSGTLYASLPAAAFERIAGSARLSVAHAGRTHSLTSAESNALRAVAASLGS